jgi:phosphatidylserine/phosphatidylglycerophosphate/cardiolipin synthase-like enzyme
MVIDNRIVLTGSFNWTTSADKHNAENLLVLHDPALAQAYERNFVDRLEVSEPLDQYEAEAGAEPRRERRSE